MADRALTEEAVLAGLQDIRLPPDAAGGLAAELLAAIGFGLIVAAVLGLFIPLITRSRRPEWTRTAGARAQLTEDARQLELLRLLKRKRPETFAALAARIYAPNGLPDIETLETEVGRVD